MIVLCAVFFSAFAVSLLLTVPVGKFAVYLGAVDLPSVRKVHHNPVPRMGGMAFFIGFCLSLLLCIKHAPSLCYQLLCGGSLLVALGISDDIYTLSPYSKLPVQVFVAVVAFLIGARVESIAMFGRTVILGYTASLAASVFFIVLMINAVNFIDGLDALAVTVCLSSVCAVAFLTRVTQSGVLFVCCAMIGALLGFLPFNMNKASIFMGDTGSTFLGYALACMTMSAFSYEMSSSLILCVALPVLDVLFSVVRRLIHGKNPLKADRGHLHHFLYDMGMSQGAVVLILSVLSAALATLGVAMKIRPQ